MTDFSASEVWGFVFLCAAMLGSMLLANTLKRKIYFLRASLIPTAVLGGILLLIISLIYESITGDLFFNTALFGGNGLAMMEAVTYHALALGFIATTLTSSHKMTKKEVVASIDTGVTTVSTYLLQGILGLGITILLSYLVTDVFPASGLILPFGYGQGTGQAMNYGNIYEMDHGFIGGRSFGLSIAALGFISAALGGVLHLNILKRRHGFKRADTSSSVQIFEHEIQGIDEIPMNGSMDKMTIQAAVVIGTYGLAYLLMSGIASLAGGLSSIIYGFNFLFGVLMAALVKLFIRMLRKTKIMHKQYTNDFLLNRLSSFFFDLMIVAGIGAIRLDLLADTWWIVLILGVVGAVSTYFYNLYIARKFFPEYSEEQFLVMYGMLTGTASTGIMLLREIDPDFETPAQNNLVYQNFPAIALGFPLMIVATMAPKMPIGMWLIVTIYFVLLNIFLFRRQIFKKRFSKEAPTEQPSEDDK